VTLRVRLASITTALLAVVLAVAGVVLERLTARDMARSLENRAAERARGRAADANEPPPDEVEPPPPPPPPEGPDGPPGDDPSAPDPNDPQRPAPATPSMSSPLANAGTDASAKPVLLPESDGAAVEVFQFQQPLGASLAAPALRAHLTNEAARLTEADARARLSTKRTKFVERVDVGGTSWVVAQDFAPPADAGRRADPPPRLVGPRGDRRPPPPPTPRERRVISIAFVDAGPAARAHRTLVVEMGAIGVGALVLGGLLAYVLAGRMLRPVAAAARAAEAIEHPKARLPASGTQDELGRLVAVLNGMLGRLEAASDRERLFLATASHELRRPLTALLGELELASAAGRSNDELRASIALARDDGKAMGRLVDDILHHAKAQAGTLPLVETDVAVRDLVADAVKRSRRSVQRPVDVRVDAVPDWIVRADADLLRRALENLVVNAAVHGGDAVRVTVHGERDATGLRLHVDDDGPGVPADELRTIFDPFGRGDRARTVPGFGLGLAIARDVARAHGGDLTVLSPRPGADAARPGSRVTLRLAGDRSGADPLGSSTAPAHP
jgi:signal transduction histidine kinase